MSNAVQNVNKMKSGTCPHGLPPGACPICSNMGGTLRSSDRNRKIGEMTYHECAMIGAMLKARALQAKNHEQNLQARAEALQEFQNTLEKMSQKMIDFANKISNNFFFKPISFTITNIVVPIINTIRSIPNVVSNFISNIMEKVSQIKEKFIDIMDKLNAIFGEAKAFIEKKISEFVSTIKSKFKFLEKIFKKNNSDNEDTKIDDDKRIFNLKKFLHKIIKRKKKDDSKH